MPVIVWIIIVVVAAGVGTAVVTPIVTGAADKDAVKTAPAVPGVEPVRVDSTYVAPPVVLPRDTTTSDAANLDEDAYEALLEEAMRAYEEDDGSVRGETLTREIPDKPQPNDSGGLSGNLPGF